MITTRKLNQVRNSFYVYLPRGWCDKFSLTKDSEVRIEQTTEGLLRVFPPNFEKDESKQLLLDITPKAQSSIVNLLIGAYLVGAGEIELHFKEPIDLATREEISRWIRRLPGFEILDEHSDSFTISDTSEKQVIAPILKRQFRTTKYMLDSFIAAMESEDFEETTRILDRDEDVNRHRYFVERLCHLALRNPSYARKISISPSDALHFSLAAKYVERIADHICEATTALINMKQVDAPLKKVAHAVLQSYDDTMKTFFSVDSLRNHENQDVASQTQEAFAALTESNRLAKKLGKLDPGKRDVSSQRVLLVLHLERIASYSADIGEVAINRIIQFSL